MVGVTYTPHCFGNEYIPYPVTDSPAWPDPTYPEGLATREYGPGVQLMGAQLMGAQLMGAQLMGAQKFNDKHVLKYCTTVAINKSHHHVLHHL